MLSEIRPIGLGHYTMPADTVSGGEKVVARAYLVSHPTGFLLFDTGIGKGHPVAEKMFGPIQRRPLITALAAVAVRQDDITMIMNCHLHLDHCGGNPLFPRTPIFTQRSELAALDSLDYVLPELIDFEDARIEVCDGLADVADGLRIIPTPGHTPGHQSLMVETREGRVLLAGQATGTASDFAHAAAASRENTPTGNAIPAWMYELRELDVQKVLFAHDRLPWTRRAEHLPVTE